MPLPTPHLDKLNAALRNEKMPHYDILRLESAIQRYQKWIVDLNNVNGERNEIISQLVGFLNEYKFYIDFDLIYCSEEDFLYRQKGQLKLDNTIIEEFLPHLVSKALPKLNGELSFGPTKCFAAAYFQSSLQRQSNGGGLAIRTKDQDFAISKRLYIKSSHTTEFDLSDSGRYRLL
jgi:hypothetical protein